MKIASRPTDSLSSLEERLESFYLNYMLFEPVERARDLLTGFMAGLGVDAVIEVDWNHVSVSTDTEVIILLNA